MSATGPTRTGKWKEAQKALRDLHAQYPDLVDFQLMREGLRLEKQIHARIIQQKIVPPALSDFTLALRKLPGRVNAGGFAGTKALIVRGDLNRSVKTQRVARRTIFVGVNRTERNKGASNAWAGALVNVALVQEEGTRPFFVTVTPKLRRFWFYLFLQGVVSAPLKATTTMLGPIRVPPRPYIGPVFDAAQKTWGPRVRADVEKQVASFLRARGAT